MLQAYCKAAHPHHPWYGQLKLERHALNAYGAPVAPADACCLEVQCTDASCFRCEIQKGGFKFRWIHAMWLADYKMTKATTAWDPDETPDETSRLDDEWRLKQPEYQRLERQKMDAFRIDMDAAGGSLPTHIMNLANASTKDDSMRAAHLEAGHGDTAAGHSATPAGFQASWLMDSGSVGRAAANFAKNKMPANEFIVYDKIHRLNRDIKLAMKHTGGKEAHATTKAKATKDADAKAKDADAKSKREADAKAKNDADAKAKKDAYAKAKLEKEEAAKAKEQADAKAKLEKEEAAKAKEQADAKAKEADAKAKEQADAKANEADAKAKEDDAIAHGSGGSG